MRIYYNISFETDKRPKGLYFDAIAFDAKDGHRYSVDVSGEHDFETTFKNGICTTDGRIKGDCNEIIRLDTEEDVDYETIEYPELYKLLSQADSEDLEFVLCDYDGNEILDYVSYEVEVELNLCEPIIFKKERENS